MKTIFKIIVATLVAFLINKVHIAEHHVQKDTRYRQEIEIEPETELETEPENELWEEETVAPIPQKGEEVEY